ncbi:MAG: glycosyltransferase [Halobacteriota archaeon]
MKALTDCTGILQHAKYAIPNRFEGYCVDDNVRALLVAAKHYSLFRDESTFDLLRTYMAFTFHAQNDDGTMRNFMSYQRSFLDSVGSDEVLGRTLWACGYTRGASHLPKNVQEVARVVFERAAMHATTRLSLRGIAYCLLGLYCSKESFEGVEERIRVLAIEILRNYEDTRAPDWEWFEDSMTYSNARLPQAMLLAYDAVGDGQLLACGERTLAFLWDQVVTSNGVINVIGNDGWYVRGKHRALGDEQAIDVGALVEAFLDAYRITGKRQYYQNALECFSWFTGNNLLKLPIYDEGTGGCFDGLSLEKGVNQNLGAESTIAYLLCRLAFEEAEKPSQSRRKSTENR